MKIIKTPALIRRVFADAIWSLDDEDKTIFLTYDDGPDKNITPVLLDLLAEFNAKATFFCLGKQVEKFPEILDRIQSEGHCVGNHGFDHLHAGKVSQIKHLRNVIEGAAITKSAFYRPPYGYLSFRQYELIKKHFKIVLWDINSYDFSKKTSPEKCLLNITYNLDSGSIILLHDNKKSAPNMLFATREILSEYSAKGFEFKSLSGLI